MDMRAKRDLDGNPLKVTFQAVADNLATIANQQMGEGAESRPFAIIRDSGAGLLADVSTLQRWQCLTSSVFMCAD